MGDQDAGLSLLENLRFEGCRKYFFALKEGEAIRSSPRQDCATFYFIRKGAISVEVDNHLPIEVGEGAILVLNRWFGHTIRSGEGAAPTAVAPLQPVSLEEARAAERRMDADEGGAVVFSSEASTLDSPFKALLPYVVHIQRETIESTPRFQSILDVYQQPAPADLLQEMIDRRMDEMMAIFLLSCGMRELSAVHGYNSQLDDQRIGRVLLEMHEHPEAPWSVSDLSARANLSRSGFIDRFKAVIGATPMNYLTRVRVERAADMLLKEALPISSISYRVGYSSEAAFHRAFKKVFKETPGDYRRRLRSSPRGAGRDDMQPALQAVNNGQNSRK